MANSTSVMSTDYHYILVTKTISEKMQKQTVPLVQTGAAAGPDGALGDAPDHDVDAVALAGVAHPVGSHETLQGQVTPDGHNLPRPKCWSLYTMHHPMSVGCSRSVT